MLEQIHKNIGKELKMLAFILEIIGTIGVLIAGIILMSNHLVKESLLTLFIGEFVVWASSLSLYAFAQLVQNSDKTIEIRKEDQKLNTRLVEAIEKLAGVKEETKNVTTNTKKANIKNTQTISTKTLNKISSILSSLNQNKKNNIRKNYEIWSEEIKGLSTDEIVQRLNDEEKWQEEYIILCCIELENRV